MSPNLRKDLIAIAKIGIVALLVFAIWAAAIALHRHFVHQSQQQVGHSFQQACRQYPAVAC